MDQPFGALDLPARHLLEKALPRIVRIERIIVPVHRPVRIEHEICRLLKQEATAA